MTKYCIELSHKEHDEDLKITEKSPFISFKHRWSWCGKCSSGANSPARRCICWTRWRDWSRL